MPKNSKRGHSGSLNVFTKTKEHNYLIKTIATRIQGQIFKALKKYSKKPHIAEISYKLK